MKRKTFTKAQSKDLVFKKKLVVENWFDIFLIPKSHHIRLNGSRGVSTLI